MTLTRYLESRLRKTYKIQEIEREKAKKESLQKRIKQLETQIDGLIKDSLKLLKVGVFISQYFPTFTNFFPRLLIFSHV